MACLGGAFGVLVIGQKKSEDICGWRKIIAVCQFSGSALP
jgi:hypothetical protein